MAQFIDAKTLPENTVLQADLCIIGAGAAGITLARTFIGSGLTVCLLEGGGLEYEQESQDVYQGNQAGFDNYDPGVSRLRFFGGSTNHWNGNIWPLFEDDFKARAWIPHSGWPITLKDLEPYYEPAGKIVQIKGPNTFKREALFDYIHGFWKDERLLKSEGLDWAISQHSPPTRFGQVYRQELSEAGNVQVYLHANVTNIVPKADASHVDYLQITCANGKRHQARARHYVLATGGIENARLLLNSNTVQKEGLGNGHDLVGRYFGDHLIGQIGNAVVTNPGGDLKPRKPGKGIQGILSLKPAAMQANQVARIVGFMKFEGQKSYRRLWRDFWRAAKQSWNEEEEFSQAVSEVAEAFSIMQHGIKAHVGWAESMSASIMVVAEQLPNPDSRVTLSDEKDALGMRRTILDWRFLPEQEKTTLDAMNILATQFGADDIGRAQFENNLGFNDPQSFKLGASFHHMGTTRMSDSPQSGVVDKDCTMHGVDNLSIAGSSVFTTYGVSNPTLSIVALSLRLAEHLKQQLS